MCVSTTRKYSIFYHYLFFFFTIIMIFFYDFLCVDDVWLTGVKSFLARFFSLGQVLPTARFGRGPFQGSIDASISLLSNPNDTRYHTSPPLVNSTPVTADAAAASDAAASSTEDIPHSNWVHVFPEAFVHQVYPPHDRTLRYFKWGVSRLLLESSRPPIVVPMFSTGFDRVMPEDKPPGYTLLSQLGTEFRVRVGPPIADDTIAGYREQWQELVAEEQSRDPGLTDLNDALRTGGPAQDLRSAVAGELRRHVSLVRTGMGLPEEDPRFASPEFWKPDGGCVDVPVMGVVNKLPHHM